MQREERSCTIRRSRHQNKLAFGPDQRHGMARTERNPLHNFKLRSGSSKGLPSVQNPARQTAAEPAGSQMLRFIEMRSQIIPITFHIDLCAVVTHKLLDETVGDPVRLQDTCDVASRRRSASCEPGDPYRQPRIHNFKFTPGELRITRRKRQVVPVPPLGLNELASDNRQ